MLCFLRFAIVTPRENSVGKPQSRIVIISSRAGQSRIFAADYCLFSHFPLDYEGMEKAEIKQISDFLADVYNGICEIDPPYIQQMQLNELYRVIKRLMDETSKTKDQGLKVLLATLELKARECKEHIEQRLAVRN